MAGCRFRPVAYRIGLCFIAMGFVLIAMGYGFPTWVRTSKRKTKGLWLECGNQWDSCLFVFPENVFDWAMRAVLAASLLMYMATFCMAIRENCCSQAYYTCCLGGRKTEVLAFVAELLGIAGVVLFSIKEFETVRDFSRLTWAHALCDFGLAVSLIGSIMMACSQQSLPAAKAAAGRIVAKPGYESLANNNGHGNNGRSASMQSRSTHCTQASPFQGRTTPHISGPYPSPAAIAAVNAAVSPKQQRAKSALMNGPAGPQHARKLSSPTPYPALDNANANGCGSPSSSRLRKSSAQERQFAGVHNQGKHPPVFSSEHVQEEWRAHQSNTWSESMRVEEDPGVKQQRALKSQMELEQALKHHANTWSAHGQRGERVWGQAEENHYERDWRAATTSHQYNVHPHPHSKVPPPTAPKMPPPPAPPSTVAPANFGPSAREGYQDFPPPPPDGRQVQTGYHYPGPGYTEGQWAHPPSQQYLPNPYHHHQPRPDSGNFPDPPPPEQLLCYEEERPTETVSYQGFPTPVPGEALPPPPAHMQPVVLYRAPSHPGGSSGTETVAIQSQDAYRGPNSCPSTPRPPASSHHHPNQYQYQYQYQYQPQPHQTFPRQQQVAHLPTDPHNSVYSTYRR